MRKMNDKTKADGFSEHHQRHVRTTLQSRLRLVLLLLTLICGCFFHASLAGAPPVLGQQPDGSFLVPTNQSVTPVGKLHQMPHEWPKDLALSPDGKLLAVLAQNYVVLFSRDGTEVARVSLTAGPLGLAWMPDSSTLFASGDNGEVYRIAAKDKTWEIVSPFFITARREKRPAPQRATRRRPKLSTKPTLSSEGPHIDSTDEHSKHEGNPQVTGLAISPDGRRLYAALGMANAVTIVDTATEKLIATVPVEIAPYRIALSPDGKTLFVANRGGRAPQEKEASARTAGSAVRIDRMTGAALRGSISFIDTETFTEKEMEAGRQPSGLAVSRDGASLYVANSDEDTVSLVDIKTRQVRQTLSLAPPRDPGFGQMPTDLALSEDGKFLYVAYGGGNSVAVVSLPSFSLDGYIPSGWFPIALAERGGDLFVASSKGIGARAPAHRGAFSAGGGVGTIQFIAESDRRDSSALTTQVARNNHWDMEELPARDGIKPVPVPQRVGEPSVFKHVVYIIKENHTYDLDLGDIPEGNGDKSLCLFGDNVTPNEHALAQQFVLLDNTYASGTTSADGHQWTDSAISNAYLEQNFHAYSRSYPYRGNDPLARSPAGFIWNAALRAGQSVRVYGEFANRPRIIDPVTGQTPNWLQLWKDYQTGGHKYHITADTDDAVLNAHLHPTYIGFPLLVSDQWRADQFLAEFKTFEQFNALPALSILLLPCDHTAAAKSGMPTPRAMVADNDLALGRIVEGISHSRFWKETLILVIEDDAEFGLDHVDGHRTVAFCISPYTRRGAVVSEPYNHTSVLRTIGLVLGLPAMNRFDRTATPMDACFTDQPDLRPYVHLPKRTPLDEMNPPLHALHGQRLNLGRASSHLDLSQPDRANVATVARAAWSEQRLHESFPWRRFRPDRDTGETSAN